MWYALSAAMLFAVSAVCGQSLSRQLGGVTANFFRITIACSSLGLITWFFFPGQIHASSFPWFIVSGVLGFGLGDVALFLAYPLLGARTAVLVNLCVGTLVGAVADRLCLGTHLAPLEIAAATLTLTGVVLAMHREDEPFQWNAGLLLSLFSGTCGGLSLTLSRLAMGIAQEANQPISGPAQAFQRTVGGLFIGWIAFGVLRYSAKDKPIFPKGVSRVKLPPLILASSTIGPVIGVSIMQIALQQVGSSAIISAISSTVPIMLLPISRFIDHKAPTRLAIIGSFLAVGGVATMAWLRTR
jgi:drug/metabolite transporter (DMT)-like permease